MAPATLTAPSLLAARRCAATATLLRWHHLSRYPSVSLARPVYASTIHYEPQQQRGRAAAIHARRRSAPAAAGPLLLRQTLPTSARSRPTLAAAATSADPNRPAALRRHGGRPARLARSLSTAASGDGPSPGPNSRPRPPALTLRRLSAPFLLLCHPDKSVAVGSSRSLREVNLRATQTLNGLIDTVEALYDRSSSSGSAAGKAVGRGRIELRGRYEVEFLIPSTDTDPIIKSKKTNKRGRNKEAVYTRRSVVLTFPRTLREDVQSIDGDGSYSRNAAGEVKRRAANEIVRLLRVAGVALPDGAGRLLVGDEGGEEHCEGDEDGAAAGAYGNVLVDEFDLDGSRTDPYLGRSRFSSSSSSGSSRGTRFSSSSGEYYEQSRRKFMDRIDWAEHRRLTEEAYQDALADLATMDKLGGNEERRGRLVDNVLARVTIDPSYGARAQALMGEDAVEGEGDEKMTHLKEDDRTDEEKGLDVMHQLVALRRLSLLFTDNYDDLEMERMGKLWEGTSIVLTPARRHDDAAAGQGGGTTVVNSSAAYGISRRRNPGGGRESGFKFTYGSDGNVTVHVPVDFEDDELLREMRANLWDFAELCGDGLDGMYPSFMREAS